MNTLARTYITTTYRSINRFHITLQTLLVDLQSEVRLTSCVIDQYGPFFHMPYDSLLSNGHLHDVFGIPQHHKYYVRLSGNLLRLHPSSPPSEQIFSFLFSAIIDIYRVTSFKQMSTHAPTHNTGTDPTYSLLHLRVDIFSIQLYKMKNEL
jgi:hypothetical protein